MSGNFLPLAKAALAAWTLGGFAWWAIAWRLLADARKAGIPGAEPDSGLPVPHLTVFKPLPPFGERGLGAEEAALETFIAQLDPDSEMLLGVHEGDRAAVEPFLARMALRYPRALVRLVFRSGPDGAANPKIAWQRVLAPEARGELWLWSDADISAPPGFLRAARREFARARRDGIRMITFPYAVREVASAPALFDALFVNVEFLPGVLLMGRRDRVDFGLGAAMLFRRDDFLREGDWDRLGASLADDFVLGQMLQPVRVGGVVLGASPEAADWRTAFRHYLRWQKTICWCRPGGFAAQLLILPVLGWIAACLLDPRDPWAWAGLAAFAAADAAFAANLCRAAGCGLRARYFPALGVWSVLRGAVWISCWLPWPVVWRQRRWWAAQAVASRPAPLGN